MIVDVEAARVRWLAPLVVVTLALLFLLALPIYSPDLGLLAGTVLVAPSAVVVLIGLMLKANEKTRLFCLGCLCFCILFSWQLFIHLDVTQSEAIRSDVRWLAGSRRWKERVLREPAKTRSGVRCLIWDGWGMFAQNTDVYLIFSPDDGLKHYSPSTLNGLPSPVWRVQRLERQWYSVTFYTGEDWDGCRFCLG